jgi:hypothetical protein
MEQIMSFLKLIVSLENTREKKLKLLNMVLLSSDNQLLKDAAREVLLELAGGNEVQEVGQVHL